MTTLKQNPINWLPRTANFMEANADSPIMDAEHLKIERIHQHKFFSEVNSMLLKKTIFSIHSCLAINHFASSPQQIDCLVPLGNTQKVSFPKTQRRHASSGIEPKAGNLSITNSKLFQLSYRGRIFSMIDILLATAF